MAFIQKAVERKLNTLEIKFLHKNVSYDRNFAKVLQLKNYNFSWWGGKTAQKPKILACFHSLWTFPRKIAKLQNKFPWCLTTSYQISSENVE